MLQDLFLAQPSNSTQYWMVTHMLLFGSVGAWRGSQPFKEHFLHFACLSVGFMYKKIKENQCNKYFQLVLNLYSSSNVKNMHSEKDISRKLRAGETDCRTVPSRQCSSTEVTAETQHVIQPLVNWNTTPSPVFLPSHDFTIAGGERHDMSITNDCFWSILCSLL